MKRRQFIARSIKWSAAGVSAPLIASFSGCGQNGSRSKKWQVGIYTRPWSEFDYLTALDAIADSGYQYVGLMTTKSESRLVISVSTPVEEAVRIGEEIRQRGLTVISVYGGSFRVKESLKSGIDGLKRLVDNCAACGSRNLLLAGTGDETVFNAYYQAVQAACDHASDKNIEIALKPHGGLNATGPELKQIHNRVNKKNFRIWYDPGNMYYYSNGEIDPVDDAPSVDGLVTGICVKDYQHPKNVALSPGTGQVDFPAVLQVLNKGGFKAGPLVIETLKPGSLAEINKEAVKAREFVEQLIA